MDMKEVSEKQGTQKLLLFLKKVTETCTWGWSLRQWFDIILSNKNQEDPT